MPAHSVSTSRADGLVDNIGDIFALEDGIGIDSGGRLSDEGTIETQGDGIFINTDGFVDNVGDINAFFDPYLYRRG